MSRVLIATTCRWISAARIALAIGSRDCIVEAVCPAEHPMIETSVVRKAYPYAGMRPIVSFHAAVEASRPDLIVPADDLAAIHLYKLHALAQQDPALKWMADLIAKSLGDPSAYRVIASRIEFLRMVEDLGINVPSTAHVASQSDVTAWLQKNRLPAVLKADRTSGGEGVAIVSTNAEALEAFRRLRAPLNAAVVAKRTALDRDSRLLIPWVLRQYRDVSIQPFLHGKDANLAVSCWRGEILSAVAVEVLQNRRLKGPAAVVRRIGGESMIEAARSIASRLRLSGFYGFDFLIDAETQAQHLIEMNARATQTCHLPDREGISPAAALVAALARDRGEPAIQVYDGNSSARTAEVIALFPLAWQINRESKWLKHAYWDLPEGEPKLVCAGLTRDERFSFEKWIGMWTRLRRPITGRFVETKT